MQITKIEGATHTIGADQGYIGLPLRDVTVQVRDVAIDCTVNGGGTPAMESAWVPSAEEIAAIAAGKPIILRVLGRGHPPVMLYVASDCAMCDIGLAHTKGICRNQK